MAVTERRGFLRGLVSLPLIGGGVTLIGRPTAAAVPVTAELFDRYTAWLAFEHAEALVERERIRYRDDPHVLSRIEFRREWVNQPMFWFPEEPLARANVLGASPQTRAALVLSAVGCPLP